MQSAEWGPWTGGSGIKTNHRMPDMETLFDPTLATNASLQDGNMNAQSTDRELSDDLNTMRDARLGDMYSQLAMQRHAEQQDIGTGSALISSWMSAALL
jgi:hypothetical protein